MIDRHTVFEIHRLRNEGLSKKTIAATLHLNRKTVRKFLKDPNPKRAPIHRASKLDPFREQIDRLLQIDSKASAPVILQRIAPQGFDGGITILRDYRRTLRTDLKNRQPFIRFESLPGEQCQVDWSHFGSIAYGEAKRKLYCLAVIECHSRLLYLDFTHSQRQETLHRCLLHAFQLVLQWHPQRTGHRQHVVRRNRAGRTPHSLQWSLLGLPPLLCRRPQGL